MGFIYLGTIVFSTCGMLLLDWRHRLAFFNNWQRAAIAVAVGMLVFILWDAFGIGFGVFFDGNSPFTTGLMLAPEFPVEEIFFLFFLCYFSLIVYRLLEVKWPRR